VNQVPCCRTFAMCCTWLHMSCSGSPTMSCIPLVTPRVRVRSRGKAMPSCLSVCVWAKNISSSVAREFKDVKLNEKQPTEYVYVPDTGQGGSFCCYFSYFLLSVSWLHPFQNCTWYLRQKINYMCAKLQVYLESIWRVWQCVRNEVARGVSIP